MDFHCVQRLPQPNIKPLIKCTFITKWYFWQESVPRDEEYPNRLENTQSLLKRIFGDFLNSQVLHSNLFLYRFSPPYRMDISESLIKYKILIWSYFWRHSDRQVLCSSIDFSYIRIDQKIPNPNLTVFLTTFGGRQVVHSNLFLYRFPRHTVYPNRSKNTKS